jgi:glucose-6-phosphate isomerase
MFPVRFDYSGLLPEVCGAERGLTVDHLASESGATLAGIEALHALHDLGGTWPTLPDIDATPLAAAGARLRERFTDLVVLGIGGSSLGARAIIRAMTRKSGAALDGSHRRGMRVHFIENIDAVDISDVLDSFDLATTAFNVVTKSGTTIETMAAFFIVRDRLLQQFGDAGYRDRMYATTDPAAGALRPIVESDKLTSFDVPPRVGGRFSVLSAVGLLPIAAAGLDVVALLDGARQARDASLSRDLLKNPAALFASTQHLLYARGVHDVVCMPYSTSLGDISAWFVQLWAESLGKQRPDGSRVGPTPIPAIGATDQHSQLQLFMEGTPNKSVLFIEVDEAPADLRVPQIGAMCPSLAHLAGHGVHDILRAELAGVREGLAQSGRPTMTWSIPRIDERSLGALMMTLECATGIAGTLFGVDPYDQPGVELGKVFAHALLGRESSKADAERLHKLAAARPSWIVA